MKTAPTLSPAQCTGRVSYRHARGAEHGPATAAALSVALQWHQVHCVPTTEAARRLRPRSVLISGLAAAARSYGHESSSRRIAQASTHSQVSASSCVASQAVRRTPPGAYVDPRQDRNASRLAAAHCSRSGRALSAHRRQPCADALSDATHVPASPRHWTGLGADDAQDQSFAGAAMASAERSGADKTDATRVTDMGATASSGGSASPAATPWWSLSGRSVRGSDAPASLWLLGKCYGGALCWLVPQCVCSACRSFVAAL